MKELFKQLVLDESPLRRFEMAEVYSSCQKTHVHEISPSSYLSFEKNITGTSLRSFDKSGKKGFLHVHDGPIITSNWLENSFINPIEYSELPTVPVKDTLFLSKHKQPEFNIHEVFCMLNEHALKRNCCIDKLIIENHIKIFKIANTNGVRGYGYEKMSGFNFDINYNSSTYSFSKIQECINVESMFSIVENIALCSNTKSKHIPNINLVMLSNTAVFELVYLLLFFLNSSWIKTNNSFFTEKIDTLIGTQIISPLISITENSLYNKIVGGITDAEGTVRQPAKIIENGNLIQPLSSHSDNIKSIPTASAYRLDYSITPQTRATSVAVDAGAVSSSEIIRKNDYISVLESFQGMSESINPITLEFSAILELKTYNYGNYLGSRRLRINSNLLRVLCSIEAISADCEYTGDGSILAPNMLCNLSDVGIIVSELL